MTVAQLQQEGIKRLQEAEIADATVDARYLLEEVCGISPTQYFMKMTQELPKDIEAAYFQKIALRATHVPLQHIVGKQAFMGYEFIVNSHVLTPRQDTEILVEAAQEVADGTSILDVCTGSGCIAISLEKLTHASRVVGVDISEAALAVAEENKKQLDSHVTFLNSNLFEKVEGTYQLIVSNPPYIEKNVIPTLMEEVREHEPHLALDGGEDGLDFYRAIVEKAPRYLTPKGYLCFEIGYNQGQAVKNMMEERGFSQCQIKKDYGGLDRVVMGRWKEMP